MCYCWGFFCLYVCLFQETWVYSVVKGWLHVNKGRYINSVYNKQHKDSGPEGATEVSKESKIGSLGGKK